VGFLKKHHDCPISYFIGEVPWRKIIGRKATDLDFALVLVVEEGL
jgi:hypothetical protein